MRFALHRIACWTLVALSCFLFVFSVHSQPNVIILLTDDQGYGDMSFHGNPIVQTPNMDRLARQSTRFSQFFVGPLCQPTRASLMTGRNKVIGRRIEPDEQTMPQMFKRGGYSTAIFGKWHLGEYYPFRPIDKGFDHQLLIGAGAISQVEDYWGNTPMDPFLNENGSWRQYKGFCTDILFDEAIQWMKAQNGRPFFCYLAANAAHSPFVAPDEYKRPFLEKGIKDPAASFYGMIANLDVNLGKLRHELEAMNMASNTLLIFMTDNGSTMANEKTGLYNAGLRGSKGSIYEGGSRAAAFFHWPGTLAEDREIDQLAMHYDLLPTFSDLCGIPLLSGDGVAELDGISLKPLLLGEKPSYPQRHYIVYQGFWPPDQPLRQYENTSIRSQDFRLANGKELYNLRKDPGETENVIEAYPEKATELKTAYDAWWSAVSSELPSLRIDNPYPIGDAYGKPVTMCALHYYDSSVYPGASGWYESKFFLQSGLKALLMDEQSLSPKMKPLLGSWKMDFKSAGIYRFTLRKGSESMPENLTVIREGSAHVSIEGRSIKTSVSEKTQSVELMVRVEKPGIQMVECWFEGQRADGKPTGAYFVDIMKADEKHAGEKSAAITLHADGKSLAFETISDAINASRKYGESSGKTIVVGGGRYFLEKTIFLDAQDAGLTIAAAEGAKVELSGGRRVNGWKKGEGEFWTAPVPVTECGGLNFRTLLVDGRCADRARYPESGRLQNLNKWSVRWLSTVQGGWERKPTMDDLTRMIYKEGDLFPDLDIRNAELTIFHCWDETLMGVKELLPDENTVLFSNPAGHPLGAFNVQDYVVWNIEKGMTRPGQWYLDRLNGQVVYWPLHEEDMATVDIVAPVLENVLRLENTRNVKLEGLTISAANTPLITGDFAAKMFDGAVSARNADHCRFEDLEITGVTGWGLKVFGDHITIKNCHIHHTGAGGIRLIGSHALIENNHLHHVGTTYPSAIALYIGVTDPKMKDEWEFGKDATHAVLRHNEIHDGTYIGIGIGGRHHVVEFNKVYRVMQELADGAGIYATFGGDMEIRNNVVRDIQAGRHGKVHAYYLDELSDNVIVENNVSVNVPSPSHNHMAKNNLFRNNIFIHRGPMEITLPRCGPHAYEKNVFVSGTSVTFHHSGILTLDHNLFQAPAVFEQLQGTGRKNQALDQAKGQNAVADAGLVIAGDDFAFTPDSPAPDMGINPIKGSLAGLLTNNNRPGDPGRVARNE